MSRRQHTPRKPTPQEIAKYWRDKAAALDRLRYAVAAKARFVRFLPHAIVYGFECPFSHLHEAEFIDQGGDIFPTECGFSCRWCYVCQGAFADRLLNEETSL